MTLPAMLRLPRPPRLRSILTAGAVGLLLSGCSTAPTAPIASSGTAPAAPEAAASATVPAPDGQATSPISERDRQREAEWAEAIRGLDFETGRVVVERPPAVSDLALAGRLIADGDAALEVNERTAAVKAYAAAVRAAPDDAGAHLKLARGLVVKGKNDLALAAYRTALDLDPESLDGRLDLARTLAREARFAEAIDAMQDALRLDPDCGPAHERLAIWHYYEGDLEQSWRHVHAARRAGYPVPPQFLDRLAAAMPDPGAG